LGQRDLVARAAGLRDVETLSIASEPCDTETGSMPPRPFEPRSTGLSLGAVWVGLFAVSVAALSCAELLGDIQVEADPLRPEPGSTGPGLGEPPCEPASTRCNEGLLQVCVRFDAQSPAGWLNQNDCGSPELCSAGPPAVCTRAACQPGEVSCADATPRVCNAAQTGWRALEACQTAAHCSTLDAQCPGGAPCCLVEPCAPGELRCNEGRLEECQPDATGWSQRAVCDTPELCSLGLASCGGAASCACEIAACAEGEMRCTGSALERCNLGRTGWDVVSECGSAALCEQGLGLEPARCDEPACSPGQFDCDGAELRSCRPDLTAFDATDECVGPAFCNAAAGQCDPAPCQPGERSCNGAQIQVCAADQSGFQPDGPPCATPELCNDDSPSNVHCDPPACGVQQFDCFGTNQLSVCNDGRTGFEDAAAPCPRADLCSAERRRCDFCFPGRQECTPTLTASRVCALSGNFFGPETFCPLGCVADTGQCQTCNVGDYICTNGNLQRCNDGRSFTPLNRNTDCANGLQVACVSGSVVRNGCPPGLSCGGTGQCLCTPGPAFCDGDDLVVCNGTAIVDADRCQGADGSLLATCNDGDLNVDDCGSPQRCERSSGNDCDGGGRGDDDDD
jgi:hypothetical protein